MNKSYSFIRPYRISSSSTSPWKCVLVALLLFPLPGWSQSPSVAPDINYKKLFTDLQQATRKAAYLWKYDVYAPLLLVDPQTRQVVANTPAPGLQLQKGVYRGQLPLSVNVANTALEWEGKRWAMVLLPLPSNPWDRLNLIGHELFHRAQPQLRFRAQDPVNTHLDKRDGRIYLTLELEALQRALQAPTQGERNAHLSSALTFRMYRRSLFPRSDSLENRLELNEGLAEYTGLVVAHRPRDSALDHFTKDVQRFLEQSSFVRSFPYHTVPLYGYLLGQTVPTWPLQINATTDLTDFFLHQLHLRLKQGNIDSLAQVYGYEKVYEKETQREAALLKKMAAYRTLFQQSPVLVLSFEKMNVSFNPSNILPLDSLGTVYPTIRVTDNWGILEVTEGALMAPNWDAITVSQPLTIEPHRLTGQGWTLTVKEGYTLRKDSLTQNYFLQK